MEAANKRRRRGDVMAYQRVPTQNTANKESGGGRQGQMENENSLPREAARDSLQMGGSEGDNQQRQPR